jgi:Rieske Fe-S protein
VSSSQPELDQPQDELEPDWHPSRRSVVTGACAVCVGVAGLGLFAACGGGTTKDDSDGAGATSSDTTSSSGAGTTTGSSGGSAGAGTTYQTSQIPVGGGKVFASDKIVVTQPTAGVFKAFSAVCTHQGFIVGNVQGGTINCFHHGSMYNDATGAVVGGPAPSPLPSKTVAVSGTTITVT